jgi:hypothetical protein
MDMLDFEHAYSRERFITLPNGNKLRLTAKDPYGFIYLSLEHGQLPESLKDAAFTSWQHAEIEARKYIAKMKVVMDEHDATKNYAPTVEPSVKKKK